MSEHACGIFIDYSKNLCSAETLEHLMAFADEMNLSSQITDLFAGEIVNQSRESASTAYGSSFKKFRTRTG